jgi:hypothetical protein
MKTITIAQEAVIKTTSTVEGLPVVGATKAEIQEFLKGTNYRYLVAGKNAPDILGIVVRGTDAWDQWDVNRGDLLVKVNGELQAPASILRFALRYGN